MSVVSPTPDGTRIRLRVQPRASRAELAGLHADALRVRVMAPPVDGAANAAVVQLLADLLGVPRSRIRIVAGESSRDKTAEISGMGVADVERRLGLYPGDDAG